MSAFETALLGGLSPALLATFGVSGTYTQRDASSGSTVTGIPRDLPDDQETQQIRYWFLASDLPSGSPLVGDRFTISSQTWTAFGSERSVGGLIPVDFGLTQDRD